MKSIYLNDQLVYPSKIVCVGRNYVDHIHELRNEIPEQSVIFIKPNSAITDEIYSDPHEVIHYEAEISFLIEAGEISAVGFGLDLTKRNIQSQLKAKGLPWERAKAFNKSAVFSKFVYFNGEQNALEMQLVINGTVAQVGNCQLMLAKPDALLAEIKSFLSLEDGDILMSGTPKGVGAIQRGDLFSAKISVGNTLLIEHNWTVN